MVAILVAGLLAILLLDFAVYAYKRHVSDKHFAVRASVLEISNAKTLTVKVLFELDNAFVERIIEDGSSSERPAFADATRVGDRIVIWVDRSSQEISLFEPDRPRLFSILWLADEAVPQHVARK